ncbi:MAG TPA: DUF2339 domain-containing protein [Terriglobales bacterium]|nr:DUF2339 domain-containing protein [Terriglobales bacterium]
MLTALLAVALVVVVIAYARKSVDASLINRVAALEVELRELRATLRERGALAAPEPEQPAVRPSAAPAQAGATVAFEPAAAAPSSPWIPPLLRPAASPPPPPLPPPPRDHLPAVGDKRGALAEIDWERWIGVRGAAVIGGVVLALAGLFFFRYSIEHGLIPPWLRVAFGFLAGAGCLAIAEWRLRPRYDWIPDAVTGAGTVILYATVWAGRARYDLLGTEIAFVLMVLVTATGTASSWRHHSLVIANIGLLGGFATPLLISSGADRPIGLFGYLLLLDAAMFYLARQRRWPVLAILSLIGSIFYQAGWILTRMDAERWPLGMAIVLIFSAAFVFGASCDHPDQPEWRIPRIGGLVFPFLIAAYFALQSDLAVPLLPLSLMLAVLSAGAAWIARSEKIGQLSLAAAAAVVAIITVWLADHEVTAAVAYHAVGAVFLLAAVFHLFVELDRDNPSTSGPMLPGLVTAGGFYLLALIVGVAVSIAPWPWLLIFSGLSGLLLRQASFKGRALLHLGHAVLLATAVTVLHLAHLGEDPFPAGTLYFAVLIGAAILLQLVTFERSEHDPDNLREHAAALLPLLLLVGLILQPGALTRDPALELTGETLLALLAAFSAARLGRGEWMLPVVLVTAVAHATTATDVFIITNHAGALMLVQAATVILLTAWPFLCGARFRGEMFAWYAAILAAPAWFLPLRELYLVRFGEETIGALPLALACVSLAAAWRVRRLSPAEEPPLGERRFVWFVTAALGFIALAVPLQLDKQWLILGWALQGWVMLMLWQRFDEVPLKYFGTALQLLAAIALLGFVEVLEYHPRPEWRIVNWIAYTYLVPAAALIWSARILGRYELERVRLFEDPLYESHRPWGAAACAGAAVILVFLWLNLTVIDWFADSEMLQIDVSRDPARDVVMSITWALYALALLALGTVIRSRALRWTSLVLMMTTIVKVFLYDLGELQDLYRVASLLGLAFSLILVSLAYQRFVLGRPSTEPSTEEE